MCKERPNSVSSGSARARSVSRYISLEKSDPDSAARNLVEILARREVSRVETRRRE